MRWRTVKEDSPCQPQPPYKQTCMWTSTCTHVSVHIHIHTWEIKETQQVSSIGSSTHTASILQPAAHRVQGRAEVFCVPGLLLVAEADRLWLTNHFAGAHHVLKSGHRCWLRQGTIRQKANRLWAFRVWGRGIPWRYNIARSFLTPWAGEWEKPEASPQWASLAVTVGSRGPHLPGLDLVNSPLFSSATAVCPFLAV